ncbi:ADP-ribosylglycohydrolase family protein [Curtobacterium sp. MCJR17_055]|uniref:ADP-ribosylglycohydrolase family protein n=1 Tax=unclassified Curtobacterium TaxID=257496 RepID=UPI000D961DA0|nr:MULTISPECIES: ADP-ribosylglycohydrolase family protein [unclassified Curtobacterium]PYY37836.1 ADP-ribosylglycohydrolase family protein [Curtobacterium sp. MCBD17_029]PYY56862.1 ADP-ribosylglycohydrolase family protein [Curtobacterium sp. MCJR17_055]PYY62222.1 ADP-ribosylglycohydrolase family protein [Curtobacterium sp. MCPF17_015]
MTTTSTAAEHALAAFRGLAIGDALGMPTQSLSLEQIRSDHGVISGFVDAGPNQRIAHGMPAGSITDDTEQAVLVAELLVQGQGRLDPVDFARALIDWERTMAAKGSLDLLGPSTKTAVQRILDGVPASEAGSTGTTNGAAMRITPVGIATPLGTGSDGLAGLVDAVQDACRVTHDTGLGIAGASAVAAAVSAGIDGATRAEALDVAVAAARIGETRGHWVAGGSIADRTEWARGHLATVPDAERIDVVSGLIGTSVASQESVVAALALVALDLDPWRTVCTAASIGGDTDTIAAMAGAVLGAVHGAVAWSADAVHQVETVNDLHLEELTERLLDLRTGPGR